MDPFVIQRVDGKGFGMFASRDLDSGELVVEESPLVSTRLNEDGDIIGFFHPETNEFISKDLIQSVQLLSLSG